MQSIKIIIFTVLFSLSVWSVFGASVVTDDPDDPQNFVILPTSTAAEIIETLSVVDDFEDGNVTEYTASTGNFEAQSSDTFSGAFSGKASMGTDGNTRIASTTGLDSYPVQGDTFFVWVKPTSTADDSFSSFIIFGYQDGANHYRFGFFNETLRLFMIQSGTNLVCQDTNLSWSDVFNNWTKLVVEWGSGGAFVVSVESEEGTELASCSGTDNTYSSGGIGFGSDIGNFSDPKPDLIVDDFKIRELRSE